MIIRFRETTQWVLVSDNTVFWEHRPLKSLVSQICKIRATVLCISNFTVFGKLAVVFLSVKIQKILIYGLKDLKNCHKFKHQNLQNSQGY